LGIANEGNLHRRAFSPGSDSHRRHPGLRRLGLEPRSNESGTITMLFEFERQACVDIYSILIASGLELSQNGHIRFTELCQCTCNHSQECGSEIASIDLEIQTFPIEMVHGHSARANGTA
jgi:hypothetical protein